MTKDVRKAIAEERKKQKLQKPQLPAGRPSYEYIVEAWQKEHPGGRIEECHWQTLLSRTTIRRWWNEDLAAPKKRIVIPESAIKETDPKQDDTLNGNDPETDQDPI